MAASRTVTGHIREVKRPTGTRLYFAWRDVAGKQHQKLLGLKWTGKGDPPHGSLTLKQANLIKDEKLVELRAKAAAPAPEELGPPVAFANASAEWLRHAEVDRLCKHSTLTDYRLMARRLDEDLGRKPLRSICTEDLQTWLDGKRREDGWSNRTAQKYGAVLHGIFERARKVWKLQVNPAADLERPKVRNAKAIDFYSPEEVWVLVRAAEVVDVEDLTREEATLARARAEQDAAIFLTAAFTGLRIGELLALRWRCVDFERRSIRVERGFTLGVEDSPKSNRARAVPMAPEVERALAKLGQRDHFAAGSDLVFCGELGGHLNPERLRGRYRAAQDAAALRRLRFHDLRHTFGSIAINRADPVKVKEWMGHAQLATTERYLHFKERSDEADLLAGAFGVEVTTDRVPTLVGSDGSA
jgi:integrase